MKSIYFIIAMLITASVSYIAGCDYGKMEFNHSHSTDTVYSKPVVKLVYDSSKHYVPMYIPAGLKVDTFYLPQTIDTNAVISNYYSTFFMPTA